MRSDYMILNIHLYLRIYDYVISKNNLTYENVWPRAMARPQAAVSFPGKK